MSCRDEEVPYGAEIDIWSTGCMFAEMLMGRPLFPAKTEADALNAICEVCGSPDPVKWPEVLQLSGWQACPKDFQQNRLRASLRETIVKNRPVWP
jgi:serine/threonine protein kinase